MSDRNLSKTKTQQIQLTAANPLPVLARLRSAMPLTALCCGYFMVLLDTTALNVALPAIGHKLGGGLDGLQWVVNGYTLIFASLLLSAGALCDRLGTKRMYAIGLSLFTITSLLCGLADSLELLVAARFMQGIGAAALVPGSLSLLTHAYPESAARARAIGIWGSVAALGFAGGPLIGGLLVDLLGWRSIFFINVPVGLIASILTGYFVPQTDRSKAQGFDAAGQLLAILSLGALTYALIESGRSGWGTPLILTALLIATGSAVLFLLVEHYGRSPMLPLRLFGSSSFSAANLVGLCFSFGVYGQLFVLSLFLQNVLHYSATATGLVYLPMSIGVVISPFLAGRLTALTGPRLPMTIGLTLNGLGTGIQLIASLGDEPSSTAMRIGFLLLGLGIGITVPAMTAAVLWSIAKEQSGIASAVFNSSRQTGGVLGVALLGALLNGHTFMFGLHLDLLIVVLVFLASCIVTIAYVQASSRA